MSMDNGRFAHTLVGEKQHKRSKRYRRKSQMVSEESGESCKARWNFFES